MNSRWLSTFAAIGVGLLSSTAIAADYDDWNGAPDLGPSWRGAYVVASGGYSWLRDVDDRFPAPFNTTFGQDFVGGAAVGYLVQSDTFVVGGEVGYRRQNIEFEGIAAATGFPIFTENLFSATLRGGVAHENWLVTGNLSFNYATTNIAMNGAGLGLGVSADYLFTDNLFAGLAIEHQFYRGFAGAPVDADLNTVLARVGFKL